MNTIVVGVDGSSGSVAALRFAIEEAKTRGAEVRAVNAWHVPGTAYGSGLAPAPVSVSDYEQIGRDALDSALAQVAASVDGVELTPVVRKGQAAEVLVTEAKDAELLVVGSRGLGGFRGLLLGSVSQQCAHHAPCPLVVVRHEEGV
jgi:nucleotide-binding universal stress UspA family protein